MLYGFDFLLSKKQLTSSRLWWYPPNIQHEQKKDVDDVNEPPEQ